MNPWRGQSQNPPIIGIGIKMEHQASLFEGLDEWQKVRPVDAVVIQIVTGTVRGRDEHHPPLPENAHQPRENPGVGDISDLELVEA